MDARLNSPGSAESTVITVGGFDSKDMFYKNSNFGPSVNIVAPARNILGGTPEGGRSVSMSGTSQSV